ncbi:MAG: sigma-70 family RNA polymerase sigma factor [Candidatus Hydrogenedens sp.]|nr:sigma-70 family RNA polymerase sigma factor [Candidatus Hydrogenedens sp.]
MTAAGDWDLVRRVQEGDAGAFAELVRRYEQPVIHFCQRMVNSREDAEDLAQEAFVRVYRNIGKLEPQAKFSTLLFGIARNLALNHLRDTGRRGRGKTDALDDHVLAAEPRTGPVFQAEQSEMLALIERALNRLSPDHREVLLLRELQGMDYDGIAEVIGCRKGTVKSRIARAREQLRLELVALGGLMP